ncbi:MAG: hypothetical protein GF404_13140 [candidate division Zixibacteria bacterium]|nr:hypothetical protein [candidate division Zixibacteria bacterium]
MKNLLHGIEYLLAELFVALFSALDDRRALKLGKHLGTLFYHLLKYRKTVALKNMRFCEIGDDDQERMRYIRRMFESFGQTAAEFARLNRYSKADLNQKADVRNREYFDEAFSHGRGVLFLSGHFDNWELLIQAIASFGYKIDIVVRQQHNLKVDRLMARLRRSENIEVITAEVSPRSIIRSLKRNHGVAVLMDVYGGRNAETAKLFGHEVPTLTGALEIAVKRKVPVFCEFGRRINYSRHELIIRPPVIAGQDDKVKTVEALLAYYHGELEKAVRQAPWLWLWTHKRFKGLVDY